jgi:hypothetical protein
MICSYVFFKNMLEFKTFILTSGFKYWMSCYLNLCTKCFLKGVQTWHIFWTINWTRIYFIFHDHSEIIILS